MPSFTQVFLMHCIQSPNVWKWEFFEQQRPLVSTVATGWTYRWKGRRFRELCTAGTAVSMTTAGTTRLHPRVVQCTWLTAVHGPTATQRARRSETRPRGRRWTSSSFWCTWASTCRKWLSSRAWTPESFWACSVVAASHDHGKTPCLPPPSTWVTFSGCSDTSKQWLLTPYPEQPPPLPGSQSPLVLTCWTNENVKNCWFVLISLSYFE